MAARRPARQSERGSLSAEERVYRHAACVAAKRRRSRVRAGIWMARFDTADLKDAKALLDELNA